MCSITDVEQNRTEYVDLHGHLSHSEANVLCNALKHADRCRVVKFDNCYGDVSSLCARARSWSSVTCISMRSCKLNDSQAILLARGLSCSSLQILGLSDNLIGDRGALEICGNLRNSHLTHLDLSKNAITNDWCAQLVRYDLKILRLEGNKIDDDIAPMLKQIMTSRGGTLILGEEETIHFNGTSPIIVHIDYFKLDPKDIKP